MRLRTPKIGICRCVSCAIALAGAVVISATPALAADNSVTLTSAGFGEGAPLPSSPASACLTSDDPLAIMEADSVGFIHENTVGNDAVHIVADLSITFDVRDDFGVHIAWQGSGQLTVDQIVPLSFTDAFGNPFGAVTTTLLVSMANPNGVTTDVNWPMRIDAFPTSDGLLPGVEFDPAAVTCA
jgi:hypothetical protein